MSRIGAAGVVLLEAPGGYGKSTLARMLASGRDQPLVRAVVPERCGPAELLATIASAARHAGLATLADALGTDEVEGARPRLVDHPTVRAGLVLALDDLHHLAVDGVEWVAELARDVPPASLLVLAGRRLDARLRLLQDRQDAVLLDITDLRLDREEIEQLLRASGRSPAAAEELDQASAGWPAVVALAAALDAPALPSAGRSDPDEGLPDPAHAAGPDGRRHVMRALLDELLEDAGPAARAAAAILAGLPLLSAEVADDVGGPGTLARLIDAGLPVRQRPDGWAELPDPIRELVPPAVPDRATARSIAARYAARGALLDGARLFRRVGDDDGLAAMLARVGADALVREGPWVVAALAAVADGLDDERLRRHPEVVVQLVRATERRGRIREAWIDRGSRVLPPGTAARRAIDAERALDIARAGDLEAGRSLAREVAEATPPDELSTQGRARYIVGLVTLVADPAGASATAAAELESAIGALQAAGERAWEADAWQVLGNGCHGVVGMLDAGVACLERALALRPALDAARAATLTYLAELLTFAGRLDDAEMAVREADAIGRRIGDRRAVGYAAWSAARLACERRDAVATGAALARAEANADGWLDSLAGVDFLADQADMRAVIGDVAGARRAIDRARSLASRFAREDAPLLAQTRLAVLTGDHADALAFVDRLEASHLSVPRDRWLAWLLRAAAQAGLDDPASASVSVARARQAVTDQGDPERIERREPELLALARPGPPFAAAPAAAHVVLLGRFAVERNGADASPPPGRPATLVKLLALRGTLTVDEAIEELWPDAEVDTGRARVRNLLNRIRGASGEVVVRREDALTLAPGVLVDARRFEADAAAALAAPPGTRAGLARAALVRATGELLPGDRYADWALAPRERLMRRHLALLDIVAADAIERGDLDEASRLLDEALTVDPLEEERAVRLGRALLHQGRHAAAGRVADRAVATCDELDVPPSDALRSLLADLARHG